jgi:hypothetical protein
MPLLRYFVFVGGALLTLLLSVAAVLPTEPLPANLNAAADLPVIRIHSDRKGPEAVLIDTSVPIHTASIVAAQAVPAVVATNPAPAAQAVTDFPPKARIREAFAQFRPEATPADAKKHEQKPQAKRKIVRAHIGPRPMMVAQQPRFGFFGNTTWW